MSKLKGLWIPAGILLNEELSDKEKIIRAIILYLKDYFIFKIIANWLNSFNDFAKKIFTKFLSSG